VLALGALLAVATPAGAARYTLIGWNNLGMHCMDGDYSVLSLLPPYNTVHAQLVDPSGRLVGDPAAAGIVVTYRAVADPDGSLNSSSLGKTNFWQHVQALFGVALPVDSGLAGFAMPGDTNAPQPMRWDGAAGWFVGEGIPITPYDDAGHKNTYPLVRLVARDRNGAVLATTDVVLPVSDEMDCTLCHSSGSGAAARPAAGWVGDAIPERDVRLNILRLHDERQADDPAFVAALAAMGYDARGLERTVTDGGTAILCAGCHLSEALPGSGRPGISPLTRALHGLHAAVIDPVNGEALGSSANRAACYRCHPGSETRCLRGAMGTAVATDGSLEMQCQSCHGSMSAVAAEDRTGWLDEPSCQSCHTGTAVLNAGQIRFTSAHDATGQLRQPADRTFATSVDAPAPGLDLYRFSTGHGGLQCAACHGSTHAEFPSSHRNDNLQSIALQGHAGMLVECTSCHPTTPFTVSGGPHGMHPVGQVWVERHGDAVEHDPAALAGCRSCHGADDRGTVLSRTKADRTITAGGIGTRQLWSGFQVGCYGCHRGPFDGDVNRNRPAVVSDTSATTPQGTPVSLVLAASDPDGNAVAVRIVSQPAHGTAGLTGSTATYFPEAGYAGSDSFTFAAWDGSTDSNLGTASLTVSGSSAPAPDLTGAWITEPRQRCRATGTPRCVLRGRFEVRNQGAVAAGAFALRFYLSADTALDPGDLLLRERAIPTVRPGRAKRRGMGANVLAPGAATGRYVIAVIDEGGAVAESDESNNRIAAGPIAPSP
jgi:Bacterial Ig domain/CARDB